jgi:transcriptional regulator with XRE-family HTH domain
MSQGPTTARLRLGAELKAFRDGAGLTLEQAAKALECSPSKISRLETGKGLPRQRDVRDLLRLYGKDAEASLDRLLRLAKRGAQPGWWQDYTTLLTADPFFFEGADRYVALESDASWLNSYEVPAVHGLVQTREYAATVLEKALPHYSADERRSLVDFRMKRQAVLFRDESPLQLSLVIDEYVFARPIGGPATIRAQCERLLELGDMANVSIQVLPFSAGFSRVTVEGQFLVLGFEDSVDQDVVFVESAANTAYLADDFGVERFKRMFEEVRDQALEPERSRDWLRTYISGLDSS